MNKMLHFIYLTHYLKCIIFQNLSLNVNNIILPFEIQDYILDICHLLTSKASKEKINSVYMEMYKNMFDLKEKDKCRRISSGPEQERFMQVSILKIFSLFL